MARNDDTLLWKALGDALANEVKEHVADLVQNVGAQARVHLDMTKGLAAEVVQGVLNHGSFIDAESAQFAGDPADAKYDVIHDFMAVFQKARQQSRGTQKAAEPSESADNKPVSPQDERVPIWQRRQLQQAAKPKPERHPLDCSDLYLLHQMHGNR